jgi:hypothetical protein
MPRLEVGFSQCRYCLGTLVALPCGNGLRSARTQAKSHPAWALVRSRSAIANIVIPSYGKKSPFATIAFYRWKTRVRSECVEVNRSNSQSRTNKILVPQKDSQNHRKTQKVRLKRAHRNRVSPKRHHRYFAAQLLGRRPWRVGFEARFHLTSIFRNLILTPLFHRMIEYVGYFAWGYPILQPLKDDPRVCS